jgi:hypothetical protein
MYVCMYIYIIMYTQRTHLARTLELAETALVRRIEERLANVTGVCVVSVSVSVSVCLGLCLCLCLCLFLCLFRCLCMCLRLRMFMCMDTQEAVSNQLEVPASPLYPLLFPVKTPGNIPHTLA